MEKLVVSGKYYKFSDFFFFGCPVPFIQGLSGAGTDSRLYLQGQLQHRGKVIVAGASSQETELEDLRELPEAGEGKFPEQIRLSGKRSVVNEQCLPRRELPSIGYICVIAMNLEYGRRGLLPFYIILGPF